MLGIAFIILRKIRIGEEAHCHIASCVDFIRAKAKQF